MPSVVCTISAEQIDRLHEELARLPGKIDVAARSAINDTLPLVRDAVFSIFERSVQLDPRNVQKSAKLFKATVDDLSGAIRFKGLRGFNLGSFKTTAPGPQGLSSPYGERLSAFLFPSPIIHRRLAGRRLGFARPARAGRYAGLTVTRGPRRGQPVLRQQLVMETGPASSELVEQTPGIIPMVNQIMGPELDRNLRQRVNTILEGA